MNNITQMTPMIQSFTRVKGPFCPDCGSPEVYKETKILRYEVYKYGGWDFDWEDDEEFGFYCSECSQSVPCAYEEKELLWDIPTAGGKKISKYDAEFSISRKSLKPGDRLVRCSWTRGMDNPDLAYAWFEVDPAELSENGTFDDHPGILYEIL